MSANPSDRDTIPPPSDGEDAYNATTRIGALPPELLAHLKAEGLLPQDEGAPSPEAQAAPQQPRPVAIPRPAVVPRPRAMSSPAVPGPSPSGPSLQDAAARSSRPSFPDYAASSPAAGAHDETPRPAASSRPSLVETSSPASQSIADSYLHTASMSESNGRVLDSGSMPTAIHMSSPSAEAPSLTSLTVVEPDGATGLLDADKRMVEEMERAPTAIAVTPPPSSRRVVEGPAMAGDALRAPVVHVMSVDPAGTSATDVSEGVVASSRRIGWTVAVVLIVVLSVAMAVWSQRM